MIRQIVRFAVITIVALLIGIMYAFMTNRAVSKQYQPGVVQGILEEDGTSVLIIHLEDGREGRITWQRRDAVPAVGSRIVVRIVSSSKYSFIGYLDGEKRGEVEESR